MDWLDNRLFLAFESVEWMYFVGCGYWMDVEGKMNVLQRLKFVIKEAFNKGKLEFMEVIECLR